MVGTYRALDKIEPCTGFVHQPFCPGNQHVFTRRTREGGFSALKLFDNQRYFFILDDALFG